jgi:probable HAF family extracellular repeat protein
LEPLVAIQWGEGYSPLAGYDAIWGGRMFRKFILFALLFPLIAGQVIAGLTLTDLGDLGGGYSYGYGINEKGHATGVSKINDIDSRAFYWDGATMHDLGTNPNGGPSYGFGIDWSDRIVGKANEQAFTWSLADPYINLIDPNNFGSANAITDNGIVIGQVVVPGIGNNTTYWNLGWVSFRQNPGVDSVGTGVNELGQGVGVNSQGGYYSPNLFSPFIPVPLTNTTDISNGRLITGSVTGDAAIYEVDSNTLTIIGRLTPSDPFAMALGVSRSGQFIVGTSGDKGFIYDKTFGLRDATSLLSSDYAGWQILALEDVNDSGQAIGVGRFNGVDHAIILSTLQSNAVPEPSAIVMVGLGGIGAGLATWRRQRPRA